jgi:hypothetical protein
VGVNSVSDLWRCALIDHSWSGGLQLILIAEDTVRWSTIIGESDHVCGSDAPPGAGTAVGGLALWKTVEWAVGAAAAAGGVGFL